MRSLLLGPRRRTLAVGFFAALVPALILLVLQYVWLSRLSKTTAIAHRAALRHVVETVGAEVRTFYHSTAERCLDVPASFLQEDDFPGRLLRYWSSTPAEGLRRLFLVDYSRESFGNYYVYDQETGELEVPPASEESLAMIIACNPFQVISYWGGRTDVMEPVVAERDPAHRIVVKPIVDDESRVVGVAGMILDEEHFLGALLPATINAALSRFFPGYPAEELAVTVQDGAGRIVYPAGALPGDTEVRLPFSFAFTDWSVGLGGPGHGPDEMARESFLVNMTLAALLALTVLGGVLLALRAAGRAVRLSEMKSDFVSNVSHELRTPLSSIRVFGELLGGGKVESGETVRRYGRHIEAESRRLSRLIDNILDFSRIESGQKEYEFVHGNLAEVVEATVDTFRVGLRESGFEVEYVRAGESLPPVRMDPDAMGQVLHNLLDNAVKYSGDSRRITVRLEREAGSVVCSVEDRGVGIPRAEQERIFDRFHRVGTSLRYDVPGSGLGLSIVRHVIRAHGGETTLESEPGRGTTVRVRLPVADGGAADSGAA